MSDIMDHKLTALAQLLLGTESRVRTFALVTTDNSVVEPSDSQELTSGGDQLAAFLRSEQYAYAVLEQHTRAKETLGLVYNVGPDDVGFIWQSVDLDRFLLVELAPLGDSPRSMTLTCFQTLGSEAVRGRPDPKGSLYRQAGERVICRSLESFCQVCEWHSLSIPLDNFAESVRAFNDFIDTRCRLHELYAQRYDYLVEKSMDTKLMLRSHRICRAQLYGTHYDLFLRQ